VVSWAGRLALTGVRADVAGRAGAGPTFALLGELDGLVVTGHPVADPQTGAAHACGHNAQVAGLLGAAMGLLDSKRRQRRKRAGEPPPRGGAIAGGSASPDPAHVRRQRVV
jgi:metal-dependent amidase/aminoacylase/carboxypeptidase family protein